MYSNILSSLETKKDIRATSFERMSHNKDEWKNVILDDAERVQTTHIR